jgi:hypothetical protein
MVAVMTDQFTAAAGPSRVEKILNCHAVAIINRCAVAIGPRQPLIDWSRQVSGDDAIIWDSNDCDLYLIPPYENLEEAWNLLRDLYGKIFEAELESWCTDATLWPSPRSFSLFQEWFEIRFHDLIKDLCDEDISRDAIDEGFVVGLRAVLESLSPEEPHATRSGEDR